jgi:hypothetical protein
VKGGKFLTINYKPRGGTISLYFNFLILNNAGLSQKPKHVARNKTYKNLASTDRLYFLFALRISKWDVAGKDKQREL